MSQRPWNRDQGYLLPPSLDDWVAAVHPVRFVAAFVAELPEETWVEMGVQRDAAPLGAPRYAPELLLSVWLAGFMSGIRTVRKLEYACHYDLSFRWLTAGQTPDHNTLWRFYAAHREGMRVLLRQSMEVAVKAELVDLALQAVDGTKVLANAAKERILDEGALQRLLARVDAAIADLEAQQRGDDEPPPPSLPAELAQQDALRQRVAAALAQVRAVETPRTVNLTDPQARIMKTRQGLRPAYNAQSVVVALDPERAGRRGRLIVATQVTTAPDDHGQLAPMITAAQLPEHRVPLTVADGGYHSGATLAACAEAGYAVVMPESQSAAQRRNPYHKDAFRYDPERDTYTCPAGREMTMRGTSHGTTGREVLLYRGEPGRCRSCAAFGTCTTAKRWGRTVAVGRYELALRAHRQWMETPEAQQAGQRRKSLIEPVFGMIKEQQRAHRMLLRGRHKVDAEWRLLAIAFNLNTLARVWAAGQLPGGDYTGDSAQRQPAAASLDRIRVKPATKRLITAQLAGLRRVLGQAPEGDGYGLNAIHAPPLRWLNPGHQDGR